MKTPVTTDVRVCMGVKFLNRQHRNRWFSHVQRHRMQTAFLLIVVSIPAFSEGCCAKSQRKAIADLQQDSTNLRYRAVEGEIFMVPCLGFRPVECTTAKKDSPLNCGKAFVAQAKHSGNYTCDTGGGQLVFFLQVLDKNSLGCFEPKESRLTLVIAAGGIIPCPGQHCGRGREMSGTTWYKGDRPMSLRKRAHCEENGRLHLCDVSDRDDGVYFCDRKIAEQGIKWTLRMAVNVTLVSFEIATEPPNIVDPADNTTKEVELGQAYTLTCKVYFPVEINISYHVIWFMNYNGKAENVVPLHPEKKELNISSPFQHEVIQKVVIKDVTPQHLNHTYTCFTSNTAGNRSATIELKKRIKVKWPSLIGYPFVGLVVVTVVGVVLHARWLELQLFYRSHIRPGKQDKDQKEFDVFLSYVGRPSSAVEEDVMRPDTYETTRLSSTLHSECRDTQTPLEVLLPHVLEDEWGYQVFLLERDVLPGGAYTNDAVLAIQRSHMLICLLSSDYLCDSNAVFILETGIQALLQNSALKLLLIWTNRASTSLNTTEPPLPSVVQRGLKVLPSLDWTSGKLSEEAESSFWKSLRKAMPSHRNQS